MKIATFISPWVRNHNKNYTTFAIIYQAGRLMNPQLYKDNSKQALKSISGKHAVIQVHCYKQNKHAITYKTCRYRRTVAAHVRWRHEKRFGAVATGLMYTRKQNAYSYLINFRPYFIVLHPNERNRPSQSGLS